MSEVGAKSPAGAIPMGRAEARCSRPLSLRSFGGCPGRKATFTAGDGRPNHFPVVWGVSSGPWSCSWKHPLAEVVGAHAALKARAKSVANKGLVVVLEPR